MNPTILLIIGAWLAVANAAAFIAFAVDKRRALQGRRRIPEAALLQLTAMGGGFGALAAMRLLRHKTVKQPFQRRFWAAFTSQILLMIFAGFVWMIAHTD